MALHSVAWFVAEADGTVLGEIASGNVQTVCAFPTDLSASKSFAGTGLEAAMGASTQSARRRLGLFHDHGAAHPAAI
jgi:hypothetical protein